MSNKKFVVFLSLLAGTWHGTQRLWQPCSYGGSCYGSPAASAGGLICVIVPSVDNPFFGSEQKIAARRQKSLAIQL